MLRLWLTSFSVVFCLTLAISLEAKPAQTSLNAFNLVNNVRHAARMTPLTYSYTLSKAANHHAAYLTKNLGNSSKEIGHNINLHAESETHSGYSGETASTRAHQCGYPYRYVKENISVGNKDIAASISGLMAGIYHRFTFLDYLIDDIGIGLKTDLQTAHINKTGLRNTRNNHHGKQGLIKTVLGSSPDKISGNDKSAIKSSHYNTYVYNMGRKDMEMVCSKFPEIAQSRKPFDCLGKTVNAHYIEKLCEAIPRAAIYEPPYAMRCPNGKLLKSGFMNAICQSPPPAILFKGKGAYFTICKPGIRVNPNWLKHICNDTNSPALHNGDTHFYEICDTKTRVYAGWLKNYCHAATLQDQNMDDSIYTQACHSDFKVSQKYHDTLDNQHYAINPAHVIWPPYSAKEVTPVFFDEMPDPLPDLDVSGYPLSVHFNPGKIASVKIKNFRLEKQLKNGRWKQIHAIREINHNNDPQKIFSPLQFAWFPLQRLDWNTRYRARADATFSPREPALENPMVDGNETARLIEKTIKWSFKTQHSSTPLLLEVEPEQKKIQVPEGEWFSLYLPPGKQTSRPMKKINFIWYGPAAVKSEIIDFNTVKIQLENTHCQDIQFQMSQGIELTLNTCDSSLMK